MYFGGLHVRQCYSWLHVPCFQQPKIHVLERTDIKGRLLLDGIRMHETLFCTPKFSAGACTPDPLSRTCAPQARAPLVNKSHSSRKAPTPSWEILSPPESVERGIHLARQSAQITVSEVAVRSRTLWLWGRSLEGSLLWRRVPSNHSGLLRKGDSVVPFCIKQAWSFILKHPFHSRFPLGDGNFSASSTRWALILLSGKVHAFSHSGGRHAIRKLD